MKVIALIPARMGASRFPGKLMKMLAGKPVIWHTYNNAVKTSVFSEVYVVTDSEEIYQYIAGNGGQALKSKKEHFSGSDRIAEAAENLEADIIVNIQGDEPFVKKPLLEEMISVFTKEENRHTGVVSAMQVMTNPEHIADDNYVKVVFDKDYNALYFSRSVIPNVSPQNTDPNITYFEHIGLYAFRKEALLRFYHLPKSPLEVAERVECLRYLENGIPIKMIRTEYMGIEIDTPEDLERANQLLAEQGF